MNIDALATKILNALTAENALPLYSTEGARRAIRQELTKGLEGSVPVAAVQGEAVAEVSKNTGALGCVVWYEDKLKAVTHGAKLYTAPPAKDSWDEVEALRAELAELVGIRELQELTNNRANRLVTELDASQQRVRELEGALRPDLSYGQHAKEAWVILFEDASVSPEVFMGEGAEDVARHRFENCLISWNCHLLRTTGASVSASPVQAANAGRADK